MPGFGRITACILDPEPSVITGDVTRMYTNIPHQDLIHRVINILGHIWDLQGPDLQYIHVSEHKPAVWLPGYPPRGRSFFCPQQKCLVYVLSLAEARRMLQVCVT